MALSEIARLDLTSNYCFSIDNPNPNEIDDAYSLSDDYSTLWIHTVDISSFVVVNSIDEQIAKFKKETNYSTGIDLYSDEIRNKTSLFEGLERKALSFCIKFVKNKITTNFKLTKIINKKAMSFQDADDYFKSKSLEDKEIRENLLLLSMC